jgi:hypothetical protein
MMHVYHAGTIIGRDDERQIGAGDEIIGTNG